MRCTATSACASSSVRRCVSSVSFVVSGCSGSLMIPCSTIILCISFASSFVGIFSPFGADVGELGRSTALSVVCRFYRDSTGHRTFHHRADDRIRGIQALRLQFPLGQFHAFSPGALSCRWGSAVEQTHLSVRAFRLAFWLSRARGRLPQEDRLDGRIHQRFGVLAQSRFLRHRVCISYSCGRLEFWLRCMLSGLRRTSLSSAR